MQATSTTTRPLSVPKYDFRRCKLCGEQAAAPRCRLDARTLYVCSRCDFHTVDFLDPPPGDAGEKSGEGLDRKGWEYIEARLRAPDPLPALRLELLRAHTPLGGAECLDIGAGVGRFLLLLAAAGARPCGLEPSRLRREFAARRFALDLRPETVESFCRQPEHAGFFDVVTLWDVIEHVNFPLETMKAALHVLKPGGFLFLDTPSRDALPYRLSLWACRLSGGRTPLFLDTFYPPGPFGHKQIFRPGQLVRLAEQTGFEVVERKNGYTAETGLVSLLRPRNRIVLVCRRPGPGGRGNCRRRI